MTKSRDLVKVMDFCHRAIEQPNPRADEQISDHENLSSNIRLIAGECTIEKIQFPAPLNPPTTHHAGSEGYEWVLCYSDDIYKYWRRLEAKLLIVNLDPNMVMVRPMLVNLLRDLWENYGLSITTLHLAVYVLDNFMSRNSEQIELKLIVITSLIIAAKVEDLDVKTPRFDELNRLMLNNAYTLVDYRNIESKILQCLDFVLNVPTVATFEGFFSRISIVLDEFHFHQQYFYERNPHFLEGYQTGSNEVTIYVPFGSYEEMLAAVNQLQQRLMDCILNVSGTHFLNIAPSLKAAACVAAARFMYDVQPFWTPFLEMQSSFTELEIRPVMEFIISIYELSVNTVGSGASPARSSSSSSTESVENTDSNNPELANADH